MSYSNDSPIMTTFRPTIPCNMIAIGQTKSGKSHGFGHIFSTIHDNFNYGLCFSPTIDLNDDYEFLPDKCKIKEYNEKYVVAMVKKQEAAAKRAKKMRTPFTQHAFIIFDDCLGLVDFHHSIINGLMSRSRHLNISIFILIQHINGISPAMRINSMYTMVTKIKANNIAGLYELVSCFSSVQELREFLAQYCHDYRCIIFDDMNPYAEKNYHIVKFPAQKPIFRVNF